MFAVLLILPIIPVSEAKIWNIQNTEETLYINIIGTEKFSRETEIVYDVIFSEDVFEINNSIISDNYTNSTSLYYPGWVGALKAASSSSTIFSIPTNFKIIDSTSNANITIKLVSYVSADGFKGFTKSIADENQNQILKSEITIYDVDSLTDEQFSTILRHELGHAFGLAHSTASEDLMAPEMNDVFPFISECDVDSITALYDGKKSNIVICDN